MFFFIWNKVVFFNRYTTSREQRTRTTLVATSPKKTTQMASEDSEGADDVM